MMKIKNATKTDVILREVGKRLTQQRVQAKFTQAELAKKADVSKRTIERLEAGSSIQLATLLQVLRVFDLLEPFGGALVANQQAVSTKKTPKKPVVAKNPDPDDSKKSHSWGY